MDHTNKLNCSIDAKRSLSFFNNNSQHKKLGATTHSKNLITKNFTSKDINNYKPNPKQSKLSIIDASQKKLAFCDEKPTNKSKIYSYCAKTSKGLVRKYNEDKVTIILDMNSKQTIQAIQDPVYAANPGNELLIQEKFSTSSQSHSIINNNKKSVSQVSLGENFCEKKAKIYKNGNDCCSFFGLYDGHSGVNCADFLKNKLHNYIQESQLFGTNKQLAIADGIQRAEYDFLKSVKKSYQPNRSDIPYNPSNPYNNGNYDPSGSCLITIIKHKDILYIANVGDSRAIMSCHNGFFLKELSNDHKPGELNERKRIEEAGGKVIQNETTTNKVVVDHTGKESIQKKKRYGVERVIPGGLSVSRTIGDIYAKKIFLGGNPKCVVPNPEIKTVEMKGKEDF